MRRSIAKRPGPIFIAPALLMLAVTICYPLLYSVLMSMQNTKIFNLGYPPKFVFLRNYAKLLSDQYFLNAIVRTGLYTVIVVAVQLTLGMCFALMLFRLAKGRALFTTLLAIPIMITPAVVGLMWRFLLDAHLGVYSYALSQVFGKTISFLGSRNIALFTIAGIDIWWQTPFVVLILLAGLSSLPADAFEAAMIDGANSFQRFRYITVPLLKPLIVIAVLMRSIEAFKAFDYIWVLTGGGPGTSTELISVFILKTAFGSGNLSYGAAASLLLALMLFLTALVLYRFTFQKR